MKGSARPPLLILIRHWHARHICSALVHQLTVITSWNAVHFSFLFRSIDRQTIVPRRAFGADGDLPLCDLPRAKVPN